MGKGAAAKKKKRGLEYEPKSASLKKKICPLGIDATELADQRLKNSKRFSDHLKRGGGSSLSSNTYLPSSGIVVDRSQSLSIDPNIHVKGTCTVIEKSYLRLTSAPDPSLIRPPHILKEALSHVKRKWAAEEDYEWACDQLKSIRQDITVQGIKSALTVDTYQTHCRIALEEGDMNEYNQSQTQLQQLRKEGLRINTDEFMAYKLLYLLSKGEPYEVASALSRLTQPELKGDNTSHALEVIKSYRASDYHTFFSLYTNAPSMSGYLMDFCVNKVRTAAFTTILRAYAPSIALDFIEQELAFPSHQECKAWCKKQGGVLDGYSLDTKATRESLARGR